MNHIPNQLLQQAGTPPKPLALDDSLLTRPRTRWRDVVANLGHFAIVSYAVDPARVRPHVHERFEFDVIDGADGKPKVLVSMVPFEDQDFHFVGLPWLTFRFGQTNYRTYVIDRETGQRAVWFFGTSLDSFSVAIPRHLWKLPWHPGRIRFDCEFDRAAQRYSRYAMTTRSSWAPVTLALEDTGRPVTKLDGFDDFESGWVILTHPLVGVFHRRDGPLGTYHIWHDRLRCTTGRVLSARIGLFDRLGIVPFSEQTRPHSVLIQLQTEFTIYLPPGRYDRFTASQRHRP